MIKWLFGPLRTTNCKSNQILHKQLKRNKYELRGENIVCDQTVVWTAINHELQIESNPPQTLHPSGGCSKLPALPASPSSPFHCPHARGRALPPTPLPISVASTCTACRLLLLPRPAAPCRGLRSHSLPFARRGLRLRLRRAFDAIAVAGGSVSGGGGAAREPPRTLFPGGFKRPEI